MKNKLILIFNVFLFSIQALFAQAPAIQWQKCLGGSANWDVAQSVQQTIDGGYIIAGSTDSNDGDVIGSHGSRDGWIVKLNPNGIMEWQKCFGGAGTDEFYSKGHPNNAIYSI